MAPNWIVVPNDGSGAATAAYQQGFQCAGNPGDNCYLTCYGRGSFKPPPGTTLKATTGTGGTQPKLQGNVSNASDPCYPAGPKNYYVCNYPNLPRPAGCTCSKTPAPQAATPPKPPARAASNACLPYGPGGYDYCQNPIGTRLPAGCTCSRTLAPQPATGTPPGGKGLVRVLPASPTLTPQTPTFDYADEATAPNIPAFGEAMAKCLNSELPYPVSPTILPAYLTEAQRSASQAVSSVPFAKLSPINQIFVVETAMALQAQAVHDVLYQESQYTPENATSYMVGWLERCLVATGLRPMSYDASPNAPWKLYAPFLNKPAGSDTPPAATPATPPAETTLPPGSKGLYRNPAPAPDQLMPSTSAATKYFAMGYTTFGAMKPLPLKPPTP